MGETLSLDRQYVFKAEGPKKETKILPLREGILEAVQDITELCKTENMVVVCIAGGSSSGKSEKVLTALREAFGSQIIEVEADNYYKGKKYISGKEHEAMPVEPGTPILDQTIARNFDEPAALDLPRLAQDLKTLKSGKVITDAPAYEMVGSYRSAKTIQIPHDGIMEGKKIIVLDGLFALHPTIISGAEPNYKIYVGGSDEKDNTHGRLVRRLIRDVQKRGRKYTDVFRYYLEVVAPMHEQHVLPTKINADLIINNDYNPETEASRSSHLEVQANFQIADSGTELKNFLNRINKLGGEFLGSKTEEDKYFQVPNSTNQEELIRLRKHGETWDVSYKGPTNKENSKFRSRPKIEFTLSPAMNDDEIEKLIRDLKNCGYKEMAVVRKNRDLYKIGENIEVSIDQVEKLGTYVEIRGGSLEHQEEMDHIIDALGLGESERTITPYVGLISG